MLFASSSASIDDDDSPRKLSPSERPPSYTVPGLVSVVKPLIVEIASSGVKLE